MIPIIVLPGILVRDRFGAILDASSTVTLIKSEDAGNILVDTGERSRRDKLLKGLREIGGIEPRDVDRVMTGAASTGVAGRRTASKEQINAIVPSFFNLLPKVF